MVDNVVIVPVVGSNLSVALSHNVVVMDGDDGGDDNGMWPALC